MSFEFEDEPKPRKRRKLTWVHWLVIIFRWYFSHWRANGTLRRRLLLLQNPACH